MYYTKGKQRVWQTIIDLEHHTIVIIGNDNNVLAISKMFSTTCITNWYLTVICEENTSETLTNPVLLKQKYYDSAHNYKTS